MRESANIREVEALGIDMMGFIFWEKSKRYVSERPDYLPRQCRRVGVFVNASVAEITGKVADYGLHYVQLHGCETAAFLQNLRSALFSAGYGDVKIIRMVAIQTPDDARNAEQWDGIADLLLFETPTAGFGGSGQSFDWNCLASYAGNTPFLLSGGIAPDSINRLGEFHHPRWQGIDLNSRFESAPAVKDVEKLQHFLQSVRSLGVTSENKIYKE